MCREPKDTYSRIEMGRSEEQRKVMWELYKKDPMFRALLWETHRLETRGEN